MSSSARIDELRRKFDENPRRYFAPLANEYRKAGDFDQAIFICQEYLPQQPGHMSGHIVFGQALFEAKRLPEARGVFETALSLDPENLIALRHLADISRDLGETTAALGWYERVLHADPRNEEIAAIVAALGPAAAAAAAAPTAEAPAKAAPPPPVTPAPVPPVAAAPRMDSSAAPTVELSAAAVQEMLRARLAAREPAPEAIPELITLDAAPTVEVSAVSPSTLLDGLEQTSHASEPESPMVIEALGLEGNAAPGETADAVAVASPSLEGLDTINLEISMPAREPVAPTLEMPAFVAPEPAPATASDDGLLDLGSFSFGAPAAPAEVAVDSGQESGTDLLDFDLPSAPEPIPTPPAPVATLIMEAVKTAVPSMKDAVESTIPIVMDALESIAPAVMDFVDTTIPTVIDAVGTAVPPVDQKAPAFVTETMAQLYLGQGHRAEAIEIYRQLIETRPNDVELRGRLDAIEKGGARRAEESPPVVAPSEPVAVPRRFSGSGPSIRSVLRELFGVAEHATNGTGQANGVAPGEIGSIDILFATEVVAEALNPLAVAFDGGYVATAGNIDELFTGGGQ